MNLATPEYQEMNRQVEVTWRTLRTIAHFLMVHARVLEAYIHIFPVLPLKDLINEYVDPSTLYKLATCTKPSVSYLRVLFCLCVVRKATAHVDKKVLNMCHQAQNFFCGIFVGIPQHQEGYLIFA